jgi:hypothetical protein
MTARNLDPGRTLHWRAWYSLQSWRRRAKHQLQIAPLWVLSRLNAQPALAAISAHEEEPANARALPPLTSPLNVL